MKRNWQVSVDGQVEYFAVKDDAKVFRNKHPGHHVSKGPDHPRLNDKGNPRTHSHSQNDGRGNGFRKDRRKKS